MISLEKLFPFSLLKEAQPLEHKRTVEMGEETFRPFHFDDDDDFDNEDGEERKLLSRYGIWLMVELCVPHEDIPIVGLCYTLYTHTLP